MNFNISKLENMIDHIRKMNDEEQNHIYKILKNNNAKLSDNDNGFFVSLNELTKECIDLLLDYTDQAVKSKNENNAIRFTETKTTHASIVKEEIKETKKSASSVEIEEWKKDIITNLTSDKAKAKTKSKSKKKS